MTEDPEQTYDSLREPADGVPLAEENEQVKGVRMLRTIRAFIACPQEVMSMDVAGQRIVLIKVGPDPG